MSVREPVRVLGPDDDLVAALGERPRRVLVAGTSGAGKTTLAGRLATVWGIPHTELDGLFHGPGWQPRPQFLDEVRGLAASDRWVTEYQYAPARPLLAARAEVLVWLDLPVRVVMRQVVRRTVRRSVRRTELWNGNVEPPLWTIVNDRDHILRWAWQTRHKLADLPEQLARDAPHVVVRLRTRRDVDRWVAAQAVAARAIGANGGGARPGRAG
ncbi:P-loop NTPase family protein [Puerhibacterium puerhi]|uniref:AAA family ATPase n=1 Tax=Puerhibacterium puerhi TaxID=2692623 RepID=UPI001F40EBDC|nr:AAA family ATPase [Puerhibacterium puerhi]